MLWRVYLSTVYVFENFHRLEFRKGAVARLANHCLKNKRILEMVRVNIVNLREAIDNVKYAFGIAFLFCSGYRHRWSDVVADGLNLKYTLYLETS